MDVEGSGRGVIKCTVVVFLRDGEKQPETTVRMVGVPAKIRTRHLYIKSL
jgi:hypothetical protein